MRFFGVDCCELSGRPILCCKIDLWLQQLPLLKESVSRNVRRNGIYTDRRLRGLYLSCRCHLGAEWSSETDNKLKSDQFLNALWQHAAE